jgi:hypothetical protein
MVCWRPVNVDLLHNMLYALGKLNCKYAQCMEMATTNNSLINNDCF